MSVQSIASLTIEATETVMGRLPRGRCGWRWKIADRHEARIKQSCRAALDVLAGYPNTENAEKRAKQRFRESMPIGLWLLIGSILWDLFWYWWTHRKK